MKFKITKYLAAAGIASSLALGSVAAAVAGPVVVAPVAQVHAPALATQQAAWVWRHHHRVWVPDHRRHRYWNHGHWMYR